LHPTPRHIKPAIDQQAKIFARIQFSFAPLDAKKKLRNIGFSFSSTSRDFRSLTEFVGVKSDFGIHIDFLRASKGGFFSMKKPLERVLSVYTHRETSIASTGWSPACVLQCLLFIPR
jgi:hypothetical protein